jgi:hypothetical protein
MYLAITLWANRQSPKTNTILLFLSIAEEDTIIYCWWKTKTDLMVGIRKYYESFTFTNILNKWS